MQRPHELEIQNGRWRSEFFDVTGHGTGEMCLCAFDGSVTPVDIKIIAPPNTYLYLHQLTGHVRCSKPLHEEGFAGHKDPLTNGLMLIENCCDGTQRPMTNQLPIRRNMDFSAYSPWTFIVNRRTLTWRFQVTDDGAPYRICPGNSLCWRIQDDLTDNKLGCECILMRAGMVAVPTLYR